VQRRAASTGFDYADVPYDGVRASSQSSRKPKAPESASTRSGDLLFAAVNVARKLKVDPELALHAAGRRFRSRVESAADRAARDGVDWNDLEPEAQLGYYAGTKP
jgi:XTP/dITP diphosphohydrolase/tetrapyrrole methylase family protein/MazG family protein/ATP diphosphatase